MESTIERKLKEYVESKSGECYKLTGIRGIPDRMIVLPGGKVGFAEIKQKKGVLSDIQKHMLNMMYDLGHVVGVIWREDQIKPFCHRVAYNLHKPFDECIEK